MNNSTNNLKRVLNDKELKEEFAEIFSQKGCNKSVVCTLKMNFIPSLFILFDRKISSIMVMSIIH